MAALPTVQPDITLLLDMEGVIREATLSPAMSSESVDGWLGRPWVEIAGEIGGDKVKRMVDDARVSGISAFRQINQRFPERSRNSDGIHHRAAGRPRRHARDRKESCRRLPNCSRA